LLSAKEDRARLSPSCFSNAEPNSDNNTGRIGLELGSDFANGLADDHLRPPVWCNFALYNYTIDTCNYGPWGPGMFQMPPNYNFDAVALSAVFVVQPADDSLAPALVTNPADQTASTGPSPLTATALCTQTCPPSGIPARPQPVSYTAEDFWPPMASSLVFPTLAYDY
jgi:hypothetical protein